MIKILTAKFAGQCSQCGDYFAPGMKIRYDTVTKQVTHALTTSCENSTAGSNAVPAARTAYRWLSPERT